MGMKNLILLGLAAGVGYFMYGQWVAQTEKAEAEAKAARQQVVVEKPEPVDFAVKVSVRRIIEEWKNRSLAEVGGVRRPSLTDIEAEINDIRRRLYSKGLHDEKSLEDLMTRAAVELGHSPEQAKFLIGKVITEASSAPRAARPVRSIAPGAPGAPA